ncbi:MAG: DNA polymerase III subunit gamma/tau, partial [Deltaproteobacteria bacterium]|nr:DNA polymerase III subunit gamma/tau [Deltaproteobacteria bacterium]
PTPCGSCASCRGIAAGSSLDVQEIDGASNRGVDDVRELRENIKYLPSRGLRKVYIIDEVHMLTKEAFNALLKTLEEPPAHVTFVFATTEADKVPPTVLSRCQRFDFRRLPARLIIERLRAIAASEGVTITEGSLYLLAREAVGSLRDAQGLLDQLAAFCGQEIDEAQLLEVLGVLDRRCLLDVTEAVLAHDAPRVLTLVDQVHGQGHDMKRFWEELLEQFRNLLVVRLFPDTPALLDLPEDEIETLRAQAARATPEELQTLFQVLFRAGEDVTRAGNPRWVLEMALARMALLRPILNIEELLDRLEALEARLKGTEEEAPSNQLGLFAPPLGQPEKPPPVPVQRMRPIEVEPDTTERLAPQPSMPRPTAPVTPPPPTTRTAPPPRAPGTPGMESVPSGSPPPGALPVAQSPAARPTGAIREAPGAEGDADPPPPRGREGLAEAGSRPDETTWLAPVSPEPDEPVWQPEITGPELLAVLDEEELNEVGVVPVPPAAAPTPAPEEGWAGFLAFLHQKHAHLAAFLEHGTVQEAGEDVIRVSFERGFYYDRITERTTRALLQQLTREFFGRPVRLECVSATEERPTRAQPPAAREGRERQLRREAMEHPVVAEALRIFGGEITEVRIEAGALDTGGRDE